MFARSKSARFPTPEEDKRVSAGVVQPKPQPWTLQGGDKRPSSSGSRIQKHAPASPGMAACDFTRSQKSVGIGAALSRSLRFSESKQTTPGPGDYGPIAPRRERPKSACSNRAPGPARHPKGTGAVMSLVARFPESQPRSPGPGSYEPVRDAARHRGVTPFASCTRLLRSTPERLRLFEVNEVWLESVPGPCSYEAVQLPSNNGGAVLERAKRFYSPISSVRSCSFRQRGVQQTATDAADVHLTVLSNSQYIFPSGRQHTVPGPCDYADSKLKGPWAAAQVPSRRPLLVQPQLGWMDTGVSGDVRMHSADDAFDASERTSRSRSMSPTVGVYQSTYSAKMMANDVKELASSIASSDANRFMPTGACTSLGSHGLTDGCSDCNAMIGTRLC